MGMGMDGTGDIVQFIPHRYSARCFTNCRLGRRHIGAGTLGFESIADLYAESNATLSAILKVLKYILLFGGIVIVMILVLIALLVYKVVA